MTEPKRFRAFISYSQKDKKAAKRIHSWLERYRVPTSVTSAAQLAHKRRLGRFFRDDEEMSAATDIAAMVRGAIEDSESLIVLCSPNSARSKWVNSEVAHFRGTGRGDSVFALIIDGVPNSTDPATECFPPLLRATQSQGNQMPIEPLGIQLNEGRHRALVRLAAGLIDVPFDDLWRRQKRRVRKQRSIFAATAIAVMVGIGVIAALINDAAHRQDRQTWSNTLTSKARAALHDRNDPTVGFKLAGLALEADPTNVAAQMVVRDARYGGLWTHLGDTYSTPFYQEVASGVAEAYLSPDGQHIAARMAVDERGMPDFEVVEIHTTDGMLRARFSTESTEIRFTPDGQTLLTPDRSSYLRSRQGEAELVAINMDGQRIPSEMIEVGHEEVTDRIYPAWEFEIGPVFYHALSADGRVRAGAEVQLWQSQGGGLPGWSEDWQGRFEVTLDDKLLNVVPGTWRLAALSDEGDLLATANDSGAVTLWKITADKNEATKIADLWQGGESSDGLPSKIEISSSNHLMVLDRAGVVRVWNLMGSPIAVTYKNVNTLSHVGLDFSNDRLRITTEDVSADTLYYELDVEDRLTGVQWQRFISADQFALTNDAVAIMDRSWIYLIGPQGIEEIRIPLAPLYAADYLTQSGDGNSLILGKRGEGKQLLLPVNVSRLLEDFTVHPELTDNEAERWNVTHIVDELEKSSDFRVDEPKTTLFWRSAKAAFKQFRSNEPNTKPREVARSAVKQALDEVNLESSRIAMDWAGHARYRLFDLNNAGLFNLLAELGAPEPFLAGPHELDEWNLRSEDFARYNPKYIQWISRTFLPESRDSSSRRATQYLYNSILRAPARVHLAALRALDEDTTLRAKVVREYAELQTGRGDYLRRELTPLAVSAGPIPEGTELDIADAAGFWVRRELDGTKTVFRTALNEWLTIYDPDSLVLQPNERDSSLSESASGLTDLFWSGLSGSDAIPKDNYVFGTRDLYRALIASGVIDTLASLPKVPRPFLSGPHTESGLNLDSENFGRYNPAFVRWAYETFVPTEDQRTFIALSQPLYDRSVQDVARAYFAALETVKSSTDVVEPALAELKSGLDASTVTSEATFKLLEIKRPSEDENYIFEYNYYTALKFWLRRSSDGSAAEFEEGLRRLLSIYDADFLSAHE